MIVCRVVWGDVGGGGVGGWVHNSLIASALFQEAWNMSVHYPVCYSLLFLGVNRSDGGWGVVEVCQCLCLLIL